MDESRDHVRREAILDAARSVFDEFGYHRTTTLEIAVRAKTSKRALYQLFGSKRGIIEAMIAQRVRAMRYPLETRDPKTREEFASTLRSFGITFLTELLRPQTIAVYRLAVAEHSQSAELGGALYQGGRVAVTEKIAALFTQAAARGWLGACDIQLAVAAYMFTLMGDVLLRVLMGVGDAPRRIELRNRAKLAVDVVLMLEKGSRPA